MSLLVLLVCQFVFDQCPQHSLTPSIGEEDQVASRHRKVHHPLPHEEEEEEEEEKKIESIRIERSNIIYTYLHFFSSCLLRRRSNERRISLIIFRTTNHYSIHRIERTMICYSFFEKRAEQTLSTCQDTF